MATAFVWYMGGFRNFDLCRLISIICRDQSGPTELCRIKGNVDDNGDRVYHVPGGYYYNFTVIDESKGERWFCSEAEARDAGWIRSKL